MNRDMRALILLVIVVLLAAFLVVILNTALSDAAEPPKKTDPASLMLLNGQGYLLGTTDSTMLGRLVFDSVTFDHADSLGVYNLNLRRDGGQHRTAPSSKDHLHLLGMGYKIQKYNPDTGELTLKAFTLPPDSTPSWFLLVVR